MSQLSSFTKVANKVTEFSEFLSAHIVPLFLPDRRGRPASCGTGLLVASEQGLYLVSAAHVFDEMGLGKNLFYYIEPGVIKTLQGTPRSTPMLPSGDRNDDNLDIAVLRLEPPGLPPHPKLGKWPVPLKALLSRALPRERKQYLVLGFPASRSHINPVDRMVTSQPLPFRNIVAPRITYEALGLSSEEHVVLPFIQDKVLDPDGKIRAAPEPKGMSGAPVWLLFDEDGENDPEQTPVVAIAIEHHHRNQKVLVATDIGVAMELIGQYEPANPALQRTRHKGLFEAR